VQNTNITTHPSVEADPVVIFFDERAANYDREYEDETPGGYALRVRREKVLSFFDKPGGRVLDVGCGPGVMAQALVDRGCDFWGLDPSSKMIEIGRRRFPDNDTFTFSTVMRWASGCLTTSSTPCYVWALSTPCATGTAQSGKCSEC